MSEHAETLIHPSAVVEAGALLGQGEDVWADVPRHLRMQYNEFLRVSERLGDAQPGDGAFPL